MIEVPENDIEYYERKVQRMEQDIGTYQEELNRLRLRLRSAEDFEIKYRILLKNNQVDMQRARIEVAKVEEHKSRERVAEALKQNDEHWTKVKQSTQEELKRQAESEIQRLTNQLEAANQRLKDISQKKEEMDLFSFKLRKYEKQNAALELQLADIKKTCEKQKNDELSALRNQLNAAFRERMAAQRLSNQSRIASLTKKMTEGDIEAVQFTLPDLSNAELVALRELYAETKASHEKEVNEFQDVILRKNGEIKSLMRELTERDQQFQQALNSKHQQLKKVEEEVAILRKQNQEEVLQLSQHFQKGKQAEVEALRQQINTLAQLCREKEAEITKQTKILNEQIQVQAQRYRQETLRIAQDKSRCQKTISQLIDRLKEKDDKIAQLTSQFNLQRSKQQHKSKDQAQQYQNGILFLQRQLRKAEQKISDKNKLNEKLEEEAVAVKKEAQQSINRIQQQLRQQRAKYHEKINNLEAQVNKLVNKLVAKSKELAESNKKYENEKHSLQGRLRSLQAQLQQLESDYNRLQETRKQLEAALKSERHRPNLPNTSEGSNKSFQNELEGIYRQKEEALLRKLEQNRHNSAKEVRGFQIKLKELQNQNQALRKAYQRLSTESNINKENTELSKQSKIATIQLELARLNNVYQTFVSPPTERMAKSRIQQPQWGSPTVSK